MRYWINTVSRAHVLAGAMGGFTQADHGRPTRLKRLEKGDLIVFYSPRTEFQGGEPLQTFTAMGRIADDEPFQVEMSSTFIRGGGESSSSIVWRRRFNLCFCASPSSRTRVVGAFHFAVACSKSIEPTSHAWRRR
jgi:hypothetical protein